MKTTRLMITISIGLFSIAISAQDYFVVEKDTTFCKDLKFGTTM